MHEASAVIAICLVGSLAGSVCLALSVATRRYLTSYTSLARRHPSQLFAVLREDLRRTARSLLQALRKG